MKTSCGKFLNLAHYFPYDVKLRLLAHSQSFLANQKARNAIVGAENLVMQNMLAGADVILFLGSRHNSCWDHVDNLSAFPASPDTATGSGRSGQFFR